MNKTILLHGTLVCLEPLSESHRTALYTAAQNEIIWKYTSKGFGSEFHVWFDKALTYFQQQQHIPFAVRRLEDEKILGSTRFYDISIEHKRLAIGYTWYIPEIWGSLVNSECKYLLLQYAFEVLRINRIEFVTDARNTRSQAAIAKLGAIKEGLLRQHMMLEDGFIRDSMIFSIIYSEWAQIKLNLQKKIRINYTIIILFILFIFNP